MYQYPNQMGQMISGQQMYGAMPQQMPQSPNFVPQAPSVVPTGVGQGNYPASTQIGMRVRPVASYDEAKAVPTDFMGNMLILTDLSHGNIYTKVLDPATGSSIFQTYQRVPESPPQTHQQNFSNIDPIPSYDPKAEIEHLKMELNNLKHELGMDKEENKNGE